MLSAATALPSPREVKRRDNNFNLLRLLFASMVILSHSFELVDGNPKREIFHRLFPTQIGGGLAVCGFFLLSGFLIVQSWHRDPRLLDFFKKRVLRIYPAFIVATLVSLFIFGPLGTHDAKGYFANLHLKGVVRRAILLCTPPDDLVFTGLHYPSLNGAMWTISTEFRCYLLVPLLGLFGFIKSRLGWLLFTVAVVAYFLRSPKFPCAFMTGLVWGNVLPELPQFLPYLLSYFCVGGCFYLFRKEVRFRTAWALIILPIVIVGLQYQRCSQIVLLTGGAYLLFWFAFLHVPALDFFKTHSDVSYGTYLYGWPIQNLLIWYIPHISPWVVFYITLLTSLSIGWLSWHLVELPFLRLKPKHNPRDVESSPAVPVQSGLA